MLIDGIDWLIHISVCKRGWVRQSSCFSLLVSLEVINPSVVPPQELRRMVPECCDLLQTNRPIVCVALLKRVPAWKVGIFAALAVAQWV